MKMLNKSLSFLNLLMEFCAELEVLVKILSKINFQNYAAQSHRLICQVLKDFLADKNNELLFKMVE